MTNVRGNDLVPAPASVAALLDTLAERTLPATAIGWSAFVAEFEFVTDEGSTRKVGELDTATFRCALPGVDGQWFKKGEAAHSLSFALYDNPSEEPADITRNGFDALVFELSERHGPPATHGERETSPKASWQLGQYRLDVDGYWAHARGATVMVTLGRDTPQ